jgi:LPXTG-motif cell wall-anchored protein
MRKLMGVAVIAVVGATGAFVASPMLAADAQTVGQCTITSPNPVVVPATGGSVTVTGTAPSGFGTVTVTLFVNGSPAGSQTVADGGTFSFTVTVVPGDQITVGFTTLAGSAYTATCGTATGVTVLGVQVAAASATKSPVQVESALAFTGSSNTPSYVLVGVAALVLGLVLVVAARRRSHVNT